MNAHYVLLRAAAYIHHPTHCLIHTELDTEMNTYSLYVYVSTENDIKAGGEPNS